MRVLVAKTLAPVRHRSQIKPSEHFHTTARAFAVWWCLLLILHLTNILYYVGAAVMYVKVDLTYLALQLNTLSIGIDKSQYRKISAVHAAVAAIHAAFAATMILSSFYHRKLTFSPGSEFTVARCWRSCTRRSSSTSRRVTTRGEKTRCKVTAVVADRTESASSRIASSFTRGGSVLFARDGLLGVDSVYFDHVLLLRELVETTLQTYQLYRMTQLLPRLWLIRLYVVLLIANCWSVPTLHSYYRHQEVTRRMLSLLCDAVLDILSSVGITIILVAVYAPHYTPGYIFPFAKWVDDMWLTNMQQEFRIMLVASWGDMTSRLVFAFGLLQCMDAIKDLLAPPMDCQDPPKPAAIVAKHATTGDSVSPQPAKQAPSVSQRVVYYIVHVVGPGLFVLWGVVILAVHVVSESRHTDQACELRLQPWLSRKPGCSLVELNCHDLTSTGSDEVLAHAWSEFDPGRTTSLIFRHCPALVITPMLLEFRHLTGMKIYNSTVTTWGADAEFSEAFHPAMRTLHLVRTFLPDGHLPDGVLSSSFPRRLNTFSTSAPTSTACRVIWTPAGRHI